jgi:hypothetical protein
MPGSGSGERRWSVADPDPLGPPPAAPHPGGPPSPVLPLPQHAAEAEPVDGGHPLRGLLAQLLTQLETLSTEPPPAPAGPPVEAAGYAATQTPESLEALHEEATAVRKARAAAEAKRQRFAQLLDRPAEPLPLGLQAEVDTSWAAVAARPEHSKGDAVLVGHSPNKPDLFTVSHLRTWRVARRPRHAAQALSCAFHPAADRACVRGRWLGCLSSG